jgi:hypothetical protein
MALVAARSSFGIVRHNGVPGQSDGCVTEELLEALGVDHAGHQDVAQLVVAAPAVSSNFGIEVLATSSSYTPHYLSWSSRKPIDETFVDRL